MTEITKEGNKIIVKPGRDIVASMVDTFKGELKNVLNDTPGGIVLDLSGVEMLDSMGIGVLVATHNSLKKNDGQLELINISTSILKLLKTMQLHKHFSIQE